MKPVKTTRTMKNKFLNEKGSALITVLILLFIFAVLGSSVLLTTVNNMAVSLRVSEYEDTYYMAESNATYATAFMKETISSIYTDLILKKETNPIQYQTALENFYPDIILKFENFYAIDYSKQGVTTTVNLTVDPDTPLLTSNYGERGDAIRFLIECIAESDTSRRVVYAVMEIDDVEIEERMTSVPPMTDRRILTGDNIRSSTIDTSQENAIYCRGNVTTTNTPTDDFLSIHESISEVFAYDSNIALRNYLRWNLDYAKFPQHYAFATFESLFEASTAGTTTYNHVSDWANTTVRYLIPDYAPANYDNNDIVDGQTPSSKIDYYYTQEVQIDSRTSSRYVGTELDTVTVYAVGSLELTGLKNLEHCYIYAEGDITINITGHIENSIIISNGGNVSINCDYITNTTNEHKLIKAYNNVSIILDEGADLSNAIIRSKYGKISVSHSSYASREKIEMSGCYLHTNNLDPDAMIYLKNVYLYGSYCNAGKDLILRNCSGKNSSLYAYGYTDSDISTYGLSKLYLGAGNTEQYLDYNYHMEFSINRSYFRRYLRGIVVISELPPLNNRTYLYENTFNNCDFTTGESIFLCDPRFEITYENQLVDLYQCRILADREVLLKNVTIANCYTFAGIRGYTEEPSYYEIDGEIRLGAVRGIYMKMDKAQDEMCIFNSVFYSRGRMIYSQHTPESEGFLASEFGKVRVYSSLFYSKDNFEYDGLTASQGLNSTIMTSSDDLCNDIIIMTEESVRPHEFYPSPEDVLFVGGDMDISTTENYTSGVLVDFYGMKTMRGLLEVQSLNFYNNYFEQPSNNGEIVLYPPMFNEVILFEDIYERTEAEHGG